MFQSLAVFALLVGASGVVAQNVPVIQNDRPAWARGKEWRVAAEPMVDIPQRDEVTGLAIGFPSVMDVLRLSDGTIVVGNMRASQLRFFDPQGKLIKSVGQKGEGPGDFSQVMGLEPLSGDSIGVNDGRDRIKVFTKDGQYVRTISVPESDRRFGVMGVLEDGRLIISSWPQGRRGITERYTDSTTLQLVRNDGSAVPLGNFPAVVFVPFRFSLPMQWGPMFAFATGKSDFYVGFSDKFEIRQMNANGAPIRVIRRAWTPTPITDEDREVYREKYINMPGEGGAPISERLRQQRQQMFDEGEKSSTLPAYGRLLVDRVGNLWAAQPIAPRLTPRNARFHDTGDFTQEWSVFDPQGRWQGQVTTPRNFLVLEIGSDYIAGLHRDGQDTEHLRLYKLEKPR